MSLIVGYCLNRAKGCLELSFFLLEFWLFFRFQVSGGTQYMEKMVAGNGLLFPILGFASCVLFIYISFGDLGLNSFPRQLELDFVKRNGTQFTLDGKEFYVNGWNSYWLMVQSVEEDTRPRVSAMLQTGAKMGLTVCRTWAFNDGGYNALQISPGQFDERVFKVTSILL